MLLKTDNTHPNTFYPINFTELLVSSPAHPILGCAGLGCRSTFYRMVLWYRPLYCVSYPPCE